jgi:NADPH:quinone reductase-like Zn-dependent oxidoreductase
MRAAVHHRFGPPDVVHLEDVPMPVVADDDVLIQVRASTVGADVTRFAPGDDVVAMLGARFGGHAEYAVAPQGGAITCKPAAMGFEDAVTLVFGGLTARGYLKQVDLRPGAAVLVTGASGAVGTAMVQLATHAGAHVTAVCSGRNADLVTRLGADRVIDHTSEDVTAGPGRYDVVVDCVGNLPYPRVRHLLAPDGALLLVVADLRGLLTAGWHTRRSGHRVVVSPGPYLADDLAHLVALADAGHYQPVRETTVDLDDITAAHRLADTGHKRGNVVVRITPRDSHAAEEAVQSRHPRTHHEGHRS